MFTSFSTLRQEVPNPTGAGVPRRPTMTTEFEPFPKIARLSREMIITEKIDGTNAQVIVTEEGEVLAGSRTRLIQPGKTTDNFGFAGWVEANKQELLKLGPGRHFGEWWGLGIQRGYGLTERRFSLFNVSRWSDDTVRPSCCHVVPTLWTGVFDTKEVGACINLLTWHGSEAAPGFMKAEGVVVYHTASGQLFKKTVEKDEQHKGQQ
jgi:RNA ligase-like protein